MQKENTGLMLSKVRGPLTNLLENLSGPHGEFWLKSLNKLLRKEEFPEVPKEILEELSNPLKKSRKKLQETVNYLKTIPVVRNAEIDDDHTLPGIINITVQSTIKDFVSKATNNDTNGVLFYLDEKTGKIETVSYDEDDSDDIFNSWIENKFNGDDIANFCKSLINLGKRYEEHITKIVN